MQWELYLFYYLERTLFEMTLPVEKIILYEASNISDEFSKYYLFITKILKQ